MKSIRNPRLRTPLLLLANGGVVAAVDAASGKGGATVRAVVLAVPVAAGWYAWSGRDSDYGALAGGRADERQALIRIRAHGIAPDQAVTCTSERPGRCEVYGNPTVGLISRIQSVLTPAAG